MIWIKWIKRTSKGREPIEHKMIDHTSIKPLMRSMHQEKVTNTAFEYKGLSLLQLQRFVRYFWIVCDCENNHLFHPLLSFSVQYWTMLALYYTFVISEYMHNIASLWLQPRSSSRLDQEVLHQILETSRSNQEIACQEITISSVRITKLWAASKG